jgi:Glycosyltransferase 61
MLRRLRQAATDVCNLTAEHLAATGTAAAASEQKKNLLIYQRDHSRKITNIGELEAALKRGAGPGWHVSTMIHSSTMPPCELIQTIRDTSVLVTVHGFSSTLLLFQPLDSMLVEVHPFYYYRPNVYGKLQQSLVRYANVSREYHSHESSPTTLVMQVVAKIVYRQACAKSVLCRNVARYQDVVVPSSFIDSILAAMTKMK